MVRRTTDATGCDPVGSLDIAARLGVQANTVHQWQKRDLLPPHRWTISSQPVWDWNLDVVPWARRTGRLNRITWRKSEAPGSS